jgi:hypothetical protein
MSELSAMLQRYARAATVSDFDAMIPILHFACYDTELSNAIEAWHSEHDEIVEIELTEQDRARMKAIVQKVFDRIDQVEQGSKKHMLNTEKYQVGDIHMTYARGVYIAWEYRDPRSNTWFPIMDTRKSQAVETFLAGYNLIEDKSEPCHIHTCKNKATQKLMFTSGMSDSYCDTHVTLFNADTLIGKEDITPLAGYYRPLSPE